MKRWHSATKDHPYEGNRSLAYLRKALSLAVKEWELRSDNPALGIKAFPACRISSIVMPIADASSVHCSRSAGTRFPHLRDATFHPATQLLELVEIQAGDVDCELANVILSALPCGV
jgi:hypothetical protein